MNAQSFATLPLLTQQLPAWAEGDAAKPVLLGICKQAWSRNQVLFQKLATAVGTLRERSLIPIVTGTPATDLMWGDRGSVPFRSLELLVARDTVTTALDALRQCGWEARDERLRNTVSQIHLTDGQGDALALRWRLLSRPPSVASEAAAMERVTVTRMGIAFSIPKPAWHLLSILVRQDAPLWLAEALVSLRQGMERSDLQQAWPWCDGTEREVGRLRELRDGWPVEIPFDLVTPGRLEGVWKDYCRWTNQGNRGMSPYLRRRWDAGSIAEFPGIAFRMLRAGLRR